MNFDFEQSRVSELINYFRAKPKDLEELGLIAFELMELRDFFELNKAINHQELLLVIENEKYRFRDDAAYYLVLAYMLFVTPKDVEYTKTFLARAKKWKWEKRDSFSAFVLIARNRLQNLDVLSLSGKGLKSTFWKEYHPICHALPFLEINDSSFSELCKLIIEKTKNDGAKGDFYKAAAKLAEFQPELGKSLTDKILASKNAEIRLIYSSLISGLTKTSKKEVVMEELLEAIKNGPRDELEEIIDAVLKIDFGISQYDQTVLKNIEIELNKGLKDKRFSKALYMVAYFYLKWYTKFERSKENLIWLCENGNDDVLYAIVNGAWKEKVYEKDKDFIDSVLNGLLRIKGNHLVTLRSLSFLFSDLLKSGQRDSVFEFLSQWHRSLDVEFSDYKALEFFIESGHEKMAELLNKLLTHWFASQEREDHLAAFHLLTQLGIHNDYFFSIDDSIFSELKLARRQRFIELLGAYVFSMDHLRTALLSILSLKPYDEKTCEVVGWAYVNFLSYNYPSSIEHLEQRIDEVDQDVRTEYEKIIKVSNNYYKSIYKLPVLNEFVPSDSRMRTYEKIRQKKFSKDFDAYQSDSNSFMNSMPEVRLKAIKWFHKNDKGYTEPQSLGKFESSFEMPRAEEIDPIGQEKQRRFLRAKKYHNEANT